jgi:hypothetical protein
MANMQIRVQGKTINVPVQDGVRIAQHDVERMAISLITRVIRDRVEILAGLPDLDMIDTRFVTTGDVMVTVIVSRGWSGGQSLQVELYVSKIERFARVEV